MDRSGGQSARSMLTELRLIEFQLMALLERPTNLMRDSVIRSQYGFALANTVCRRPKASLVAIPSRRLLLDDLKGKF